MASTLSISGIASGIDGASVATAIKEQYTVQNEISKNQISSLEDENTSLEKLRTLLLNVSDKLEGLQTISGGANIKSATSANTDIVTVASDSSANPGTFAITVSSLAQTASGSFNKGFSSTSELIAKDASQTGQIGVTVGTGDDAFSFNVDISSATTAAKFVDEFNKKADGKASASLVNVGTTTAADYRIVFSSNEQGTEEGSISLTSNNDNLLDTALGGVTLEQATDAEFSVSGISGTIKRASNDITDVITGVSMQLKSEGTTVVTVDSQAGVSSGDVKSFVDAFNSLVEFVNKEDAVSVTNSDGKSVNSYGSLAATDVDDRAISDLRSAILGTSSNDGSLSLASLGVTTNRDGTLAYDEEKFKKAVSSNPDKAAEAITNLADKVSGVKGVTYSYTGYGLGIDSEVSGNEAEISQLNETISRVEKIGTDREQAILKQFSGLEGLMAKLNNEATLISSLLKF